MQTVACKRRVATRASKSNCQWHSYASNNAELELVFVKASFPRQLCHVTFLRSKIGLIVFRSISYINPVSLVEFR